MENVPRILMRRKPSWIGQSWIGRTRLLLVLGFVFHLVISLHLVIPRTQVPYRRNVAYVRPTLSLPNPSGKCALRQLDWNSNDRHDRFPSVEERVCLYMTTWYDPYYGTDNQWISLLSYHKSGKKLIIEWNQTRVAELSTDIQPDVPFHIFQGKLEALHRISNRPLWVYKLFGIPFHEAKTYVPDMLDFLRFVPNDAIPVLTQWGDRELGLNVPLPVLSKWRFNDLNLHRRPVPIVIRLEGSRHFDPLMKVKDFDIPWEKKKDVALWRGDLSGTNYDDDAHIQDFSYSDPKSICFKFDRCRMVYRNIVSSAESVDVALTRSSVKHLQRIEGVNLIRPRVSMKDMLEHKMLISIEGNDVASGLKWNLYSNSVVLMPPPTKSIISMEMLLKPYVHYVPLDLDDVDEAVNWVLQNQDEAKQISQRATQFIEDLFFHENSEMENQEVQKRIADRYSALWVG